MALGSWSLREHRSWSSCRGERPASAPGSTHFPVAPGCSSDMFADSRWCASAGSQSSAGCCRRRPLYLDGHPSTPGCSSPWAELTLATLGLAARLSACPRGSLVLETNQCGGVPGSGLFELTLNLGNKRGQVSTTNLANTGCCRGSGILHGAGSQLSVLQRA